ncbi:Uncharacterized protein TCM_024982 [Theobroma cacao]|uniref:Uncharacterized protein n=1 Tax=Theobroma cacao TaxID=3641 RepID=A0A061EWU3_THECC|nr:Uncharacterized protein TCM_024982 [Theobroma cacao]
MVHRRLVKLPMEILSVGETNAKKSYVLTLSQKYGDVIWIQSKFDLEAWIEVIGRSNITRTHVYDFGTIVPASRLLTLETTCESTCGHGITRPPLPPTLEPKGYQQLFSNVGFLMTSVGNINNLLEVIASRLPPSNTFGSSTSQ